MAIALVVALATGLRMPNAIAEQESPYKVNEFPIRVAPGIQSAPIISGKWITWREEANDQKRIPGRNLETSLDFNIATENLVQSAEAGGDTVVTLETNDKSELGIFGYKLPDGQRFAIAPLQGGTGFNRGWQRTDGQTVVWAEGTIDSRTIYAYGIAGQATVTVTSQASRKESPAVSGNTVVWLDNRNATTDKAMWDVYGADLSTRQEFRLTSNPEYLAAPAISGNIVVWSVQRNNTGLVQAYDLVKKQEFNIATSPFFIGSTSGAVDGDLVVWSAKGDYDDDIFGYDLKQAKQFIVTRAIGSQSQARVSGKTIVWTDARSSGVGKNEYNSDINGAKLDPGPAPNPSIIGAPNAVDTKIEIVWPHGGVPPTQADKANIGAWLFAPDSLNLAPCQWSPRVQLWKSVNSEPLKPVATGQKVGSHFYANGRGVPSWDFNDVDVSAARDSKNRVFFLATIEGLAGRTNVWSHGADARTYFPQQDKPTGVITVTGAVDAKIEIVWPLNNAPVAQAKQVNISASVFASGTLQSVPPDWNPTVRLYRSLNNEVGKEVGVGLRRMVSAGSFAYPAWDFNGVDVSAATDPVNKYYFTLSVDNVPTNSNIWAHGADARTYFPQMDTPTQSCQ